MLATGQRFRAHAFDFACAQLAIDHRLTKFNHPWINGQAERMVRTVKEATIPGFYHATHACLRALLDAYNFAKRLKSLSAGSHASSESVKSGQSSFTSSDSTLSTTWRD